MDGGTKPFLIIGGGVSGLSLAEGLRKNTDLPFRVFERDPSLHARPQGYRVRVSQEGIEALQHNLPRERYERLLANACAFVADGCRHNTIDVVIDGNTGQEEDTNAFNAGKSRSGAKGEFHGDPNDLNEKPLAVDRGVLRQVLWEGLSDVVEFNKNFLRWEQLEDNSIRAHFQDGAVVEGCAIVGSDGCWSHTRKQLIPDYSLKDSEARVIWGKAELTDDFLAALPAPASHGLGFFTTPHLKVLFEAMRFDHQSPRTDEKICPENYFYYIMFPRKEQLFGLDDAQFLALSNDDAGELTKRLTNDWEASTQVPFQRLAPHAASVSRIPTATPDLPTLDAGSVVTLMGDAIHAMAPTAALGATTALRDSLHLGRQLERLPSNPKTADIAEAFREYEKEMRVYAAQALELSAAGGRVVFGFRGFDSIPEIPLH